MITLKNFNKKASNIEKKKEDFLKEYFLDSITAKWKLTEIINDSFRLGLETQGLSEPQISQLV